MPEDTSVESAARASRAERSLAAKVAAHTRWANEDPVEGTAAARRAGPGQRSYWEQRVDPTGSLSAAERARRAESAKKAHYAALALASARSRRIRATGSAS